jgi:HK97 gp10 family phage protein
MKKQWPQRRKKVSGVSTRVGKLTTLTGSWSNSGAYWWRFAEFGTSKQAAKPFMRPAFTQQGGRALAAIKIMLEKAVVIAAASVQNTGGGRWLTFIFIIISIQSRILKGS